MCMNRKLQKIYRKFLEISANILERNWEFRIYSGKKFEEKLTEIEGSFEGIGRKLWTMIYKNFGEFLRKKNRYSCVNLKEKIVGKFRVSPILKKNTWAFIFEK